MWKREEHAHRELKDIASVSPKKMCTPCFSDKDLEDVDIEQTNSPTYSGMSEAIDTALGLTENHFSRPEGYFCFSTLEELEMAIDRCKDMIKAADPADPRKRHLVSKLVQLKLKVQELEDAPEEPPDLKVVLGHNFELRSLERPQQYCEKCCGIIWGVMKNWYRCKNCGFKCHGKCLNLITRICASNKISENCSYELSICPESGLSFQKFRCAECKKKFIFKNDACLPRRCDYNGQFYCPRCHWNSIIIIPARVIHDWDFTPQKVCRASLQFLRLMSRKPILDVEALNPTLFALVSDLGEIKKLRADILRMKQYFLSCRAALDDRLLLLLRDRQHFVEGGALYSLQDLSDAHSGNLLLYLQDVHAAFLAHITQHCQGCRGKGFICELCKSEDVIFPFDPRTETCTACSSLFHQDCYVRWKGHCPKCTRRRKSSVTEPDN